MSAPVHRSHPCSHTMAMSDTNSGPAQWAQLGGWPSAGASDSVVVSATSSPTINGPKPAAVPRGTAMATGMQQPGIEGGRVGKPARRRSRASRRAPTTMLNTDTTNFRSMVQQFTGIPSGPYSGAYGPGGGAMSGMGYNFNEPIDKATLMSFGHLHQQQQQQQQQQYQFPDHTPFITAIGGGGGGGSSSGNNNNGRIDDGFLQGFNSSGTKLGGADGFFFDGMFNQMMPRPASTGNRADGYFS